jgi:hypothetical protein
MTLARFILTTSIEAIGLAVFIIGLSVLVTIFAPGGV